MKDTVTVRKVAPTASKVLVASSCQNAGSAAPISEKWSRVGDPVHEGGRVLLSGVTPNDASSAQISGRSSARPTTRSAPVRAASGGGRFTPRDAALTAKGRSAP